MMLVDPSSPPAPPGSGLLHDLHHDIQWLSTRHGASSYIHPLPVHSAWGD